MDGNRQVDRPLFVQFCANDPVQYLEAAKFVQPYCDAVDLNLGCPQGIAKRGNYGAFLQEDWDLIHQLISTLHKELDIPVTAKCRIQETKEKTLEYAKMILSAGASIITVHGRQRDQKGHKTGLADWSVIRYLREQLPPETVIFANGNILQNEDLAPCLEATGADGVMSAEGNLYDPSIFATPPPVGEEGREYWRGRDGKGGYRMDAALRRYLDIIHRYVLQQDPPERAPLFMASDAAPVQEPANVTTSGDATPATDIPEPQTGDKRPAPSDESPKVNETRASKKQRKREAKNAAKQAAQQKGNGAKKGKEENPLDREPNMVAMQSHCFHMLRPLVAKHTNVRDALARTKCGDIEGYERVLTLTEEAVKIGLMEYQKDPAVFEDAAAEEVVEVKEASESSDDAVRRCKRPYWVCQPYVRPLPKEALEKGSLQLSKKELRLLQEEETAKKKAGAAGASQVNGQVTQEVAKAGDEDAVESGVTPGGKVEDVGREVKKEVSLPPEASEAEKDATLKVPKEGMVCG